MVEGELGLNLSSWCLGFAFVFRIFVFLILKDGKVRCADLGERFTGSGRRVCWVWAVFSGFYLIVGRVCAVFRIWSLFREDVGFGFLVRFVVIF